jgi:hypothetical protein
MAEPGEGHLGDKAESLWFGFHGRGWAGGMLTFVTLWKCFHLRECALGCRTVSSVFFHFLRHFSLVRIPRFC